MDVGLDERSVVNTITEEMFNFAWRHLLILVPVKGKYKLREWLGESYEVFSIFLNFPPEHWMKIKYTNILERLNNELNVTLLLRLNQSIALVFL